MLKKDPSPRSFVQTIAIRPLKRIMHDLLPLQIIGTGNRVLQTDTNDYYCATILLEEEEDGKRWVYEHKSGMFKPSESPYHSTFKKIPAVKNGIKKFEFHLIRCLFLVEINMSSFISIPDLKPKKIPYPQLLRRKECGNTAGKYSRGMGGSISNHLAWIQIIHLPIHLHSGALNSWMTSNSSIGICSTIIW